MILQEPILRGKGIMPATDTRSLDKALAIVRATHKIPGVFGYKIGSLVSYRNGLLKVVEEIRAIDKSKHICFDGQKSGTDIPPLGEEFAELCAECQVDSVILFPLSGPVTQEKWTNALMTVTKLGIPVWIGGRMTHDGFLSSDLSGGIPGYIRHDAPQDMYWLGAEMGVRNFIVPGNHPQAVSYFHELVSGWIGNSDFTFASPGLVRQGGTVTDAGNAAGNNWIGIVGRDISEKETSDEMHEAALKLVSQL